jgi:S1-C subfamily serine protease
LQANDVILGLNNMQVNNLRDLLEARMSVIGANTGMVIFRNQKEVKKWVELEDKK